MSRTPVRFVTLALLLAATLAAMVLAEARSTPEPATPLMRMNAAGPLAVTGRLVQGVILPASVGGDGRVSMELEITAAEPPATIVPRRGVDMVVVMDRSGSMDGEKIVHARTAIAELAGRLGPGDRMALVTYADTASVNFGLTPMTEHSRRAIAQAVEAMIPGGATNLSGGLQRAITLLGDANSVNTGLVLLVSDGLANRGLTDSASLMRLARQALPGEFAISTAGVGLDFNEQLMAALADAGGGRYRFIENPNAFAGVFAAELGRTRSIAARGLAVRVGLSEGVVLESAGGYPVTTGAGFAEFYPGDILTGQTRRLFLTFRLPALAGESYPLGAVSVAFTTEDGPRRITLPGRFAVACAADRERAVSSLDADAWERQVVQEETNRLKEEVAADIKNGRIEQAATRIADYRRQAATTNETVGSQGVARVLDELGALETKVEQTAQEPAPELRKQQAKQLQYEGYAGRRSLE